MDDLLAHALVVATVTLALVQGASMIWSLQIARALVGQPGEQLSSILAFLSIATFLSQLLAVARAILIDVDARSTLVERIVLFLASQVVITVASVVAMILARRLTS